jgi:hypothetical protein
MNNIFQIRQTLKGLKKKPWKSYYRYNIGNFELDIYPYHSFASVGESGHADVYTRYRKYGRDVSVNLEKDYRFKHYKPIKYAAAGCSTGTRMPIYNLCHLIKYLYSITAE